MGLGMMSTITLPVFNRTEGGNQSMVGVMGVDMALQEMTDFEPAYEIGPAGYSFGINRNGHVLFHPDLKTEFEYADEPPHLDFLDVEIANDAKEELREAMINSETSSRALSSLLKMPDGKHIVRHHMEYYYTPINKTSFSIAVVVPTDRKHYLVVDGMDFGEEFDLLEHEKSGMHLAPWKYCYGTVMKTDLDDILRNLSQTARESPSKCKMQLLHRLVWDIRKTADIMHYWQSEDRDNKRPGVVATFVQSEGGLTRIYPPSESQYLVDQTDPSRSLIFQRAFYGDDYVFSPPDEKSNTSSDEYDPVITIVKSISFSRSGITYKPAVVGIMVHPSWLQPHLFSMRSGPGSCSDDDFIVCYLIDDGGFILSTNQIDNNTLIGKFLGKEDPEIMTELYEKGIFGRNEDINYEDRCPKEQKKSAGFKITALPFYSTISALKISWLFDLAAWSQLKYWFLSFFSLLNVPKTEALPEFYELSNETTCITHKAQYFWGRWGRSYSGDIYCSNCTRHYALAKVGQTNALLLVTTKQCGAPSCPDLPLLQAKEEILTPEGNPCTQDGQGRKLRYRRKPDKCYFYSPDENNSECGAVGTLALPHLALIVELLCLMIVTKLVHTESVDASFAQY